MPIRGVILAVVVALAALAGAGVWWWQQRGETSVTATDEHMCGLAQEESALHDVVGQGDRTIAIIGDSYTLGTGSANKQTDAWPVLFARDTGTRVIVRGQGRTGYLNGGYCGDNTFGSRATEVAALDAETVVIAGGINDVGVGDPAAAATELAKSFPGKQVIIIGPMLVPARDADRTRQVDRQLSAAARAAGAEYVTALDWNVALTDDGVHPSSEGYRDYAQRVAKAMRL